MKSKILLAILVLLQACEAPSFAWSHSGGHHSGYHSSHYNVHGGGIKV